MEDSNKELQWKHIWEMHCIFQVKCKKLQPVANTTCFLNYVKLSGGKSLNMWH